MKSYVAKNNLPRILVAMLILTLISVWVAQTAVAAPDVSEPAQDDPITGPVWGDPVQPVVFNGSLLDPANKGPARPLPSSAVEIYPQLSP